MSKFSFSRFIYLDTCIFSELVKRQKLIPPFSNFLVQNDLCIAVSQALWLELSPKKHTHQTIDAILTLLPSAVIKEPSEVLAEEVASHPNKVEVPLLKSPLNLLMGTQFIQQELSGIETANARRKLLRDSPLLTQKLNQLKPNFPPSESGKYPLARAELYADIITLQWLAMEHPSFVKQFSEKVSNLNTDVFQSVKIFAYYTYYKYYNQNKAVSKTDFADLFHLYCMPYCHTVVVERDMCNILNQVKQNHRILKEVSVKNMDFLNELN